MRSVTGRTEITGAESVYDSAKAGRAKAVVRAVKIRVLFMVFPRSCSGDSISAAVRRRAWPRARHARGRRAHLDVHRHLLAGIVGQARAQLASVVLVAHIVAHDALARFGNGIATLDFARHGHAIYDDVAVRGRVGIALDLVAD